jgi:hypothetical protein
VVAWLLSSLSCAVARLDLLTAYAALVEQHKKVTTTTKRPPKRNQNRDGKQRKGGDKEPTAPKDAADKDRPCDFYCYAHGKQNSHASPQCKVMLNDRANFTKAIRKASQVAHRRPRRINLGEGPDRTASPGPGIHGHRRQH